MPSSLPVTCILISSCHAHNFPLCSHVSESPHLPCMLSGHSCTLLLHWITMVFPPRWMSLCVYACISVTREGVEVASNDTSQPWSWENYAVFSLLCKKKLYMSYFIHIQARSWRHCSTSMYFLSWWNMCSQVPFSVSRSAVFIVNLNKFRKPHNILWMTWVFVSRRTAIKFGAVLRTKSWRSS